MEIRRSNRHKRANRKTISRLILGAVFLIGIMIIFWYNVREYQDAEVQKIVDDKSYVPAAVAGEVYHRPFFSLSYVEAYELPEWVAYRLNVEMLNAEKFPRDQDFLPDAGIKEGSAHYRDYKNSGYRRGHMVPAADMAWNKNAMDATFLMSNIAPMLQSFNDGIWLELEHNVRDWARLNKEVLVVAGPVWNDFITTISENNVLVPRYFFKAVFTVKNDEPYVIGFLFDQTIEHGGIEQYIVPVDSIEKITGLDLFSNHYGSWDKEISLEKEKSSDQKRWPFNEKWKDRK